MPTTESYPRLQFADTSAVADKVARRLGRERLLEASLDQIEQAIAIVGPAGKVVHANRAFQHLARWDADVRAKDDVDGLFSEPVHRDLPWNRGGPSHDVGRWCGTRRLRRRDGMLPVDVEAEQLAGREDGGVVYLLRLREASGAAADAGSTGSPSTGAELSRVATGIAHDCNNQLSVILNYTYILAKQLSEDAALREHVEEMRQAAWQAAQLTEHLLELTRNAGHGPALVDVGRTIRASRPLLDQVVGREARLQTRVADDLWSVRAHPAELEAILVNLASTVRDVTQGRGAIEIGARNVVIEAPSYAVGDTLDPGSYVLIEVRHTGTQPDLFDSQILPRGSMVGPTVLLEAVTDIGGRLSYVDDPGAGAIRAYFPAVVGGSLAGIDASS